MNNHNVLASIRGDTSIIREKLNRLREVLPERFSDDFFCMVSSLLNNIVFVNGPASVSASGTFDIICTFDFDGAAYDEVMSEARALKADSITH